MRIEVTGERAWVCDELATLLLQPSIARYGRDLVVIHGGCPGVDQSFIKGCKSLHVAVEVRLVQWPQTGTPTIGTRNREPVKPGADLCIALHRPVDQ